MSSARPRGRVFMMLAIVVILLGLIQSPPLYRESIPGTLVTFDMVLVSGGQMKPFYIGRTEVTWDLYDVYALGLDKPPATGGADAIARPSQPYGAPDQGWGHAGYPAIGVTRHAADAFCRWLSTKTGKTYRLPTEAEWAEAAALAAGSGPLSSARLSELAWHRGNAGGRAHPVGTKVPDAIGLSDLFGNASDSGRPYGLHQLHRSLGRFSHRIFETPVSVGFVSEQVRTLGPELKYLCDDAVVVVVVLVVTTIDEHLPDLLSKIAARGIGEERVDR